MAALQSVIDGYQKERANYVKSKNRAEKDETKECWQAKFDDVNTRIAGCQAQMNGDE
jgi:hypothetical protein